MAAGDKAPAAKAPKATDTPATIGEQAARAKETAAKNRTTGIDFGAELDEDSFKSVRESPIAGKLEQLVAGVKAGRGKLGKFYCVAEYTGVSGARTTINTLSKNVDRLPKGVVLDFRVNIVKTDAGKYSELWASVVEFVADEA